MYKTFLLSLFLILGSSSVIAATDANLSDSIDKNQIPAELEDRENEEVNLPDRMDKNEVPSTLEQREEKEEWREDYGTEQTDGIYNDIRED